MSEELKETPKRKRRSKEEIEAARAAGELPSKKAKKLVEKEIKNEPKAPEEFAAKPTKIPAERSVLIMACLNPEVSMKASEAAKEKGVEVVILEDRVIHDYLQVRGLEGSEKRSIQDFLSDTSNRLHAEDQCVKLWMILTGGKPIESSDIVFNRTEVVKKTNLTHSKADKVFQLLRAFGMLEFVKGNFEFKLHFSKNRCHQTIKTEILSVCHALNNDILRFKTSLESDNNLTKDQKKEMYELLQRNIDSTIEF